MVEFKKIVGANLAAFRKEKGLTQEGLAELIGVTQTSIQAIESGKTWMKYSTLLKMAKALGVEPIHFFEHEHEKRPDLTSDADIVQAVIARFGFKPPRLKEAGKWPAKPKNDDKKIRALVVDDNAQHRALVAQALKRIGWQISEVADGAAAIVALAKDAHVDVVISDNTMPRIDGMRLMEIMAEAYPDVLRVFVSATVDREKASAHLFIAKPFDIRELVKQVAALVTEKHKKA